MASVQTIQTSWETVDSGKQDLQWHLYWCDLNALLAPMRWNGRGTCLCYSHRNVAGRYCFRYDKKVERGQPMSLFLKNNGEEFVIQHEIQHKSRKDKVDRKIHIFGCIFSNGQKTFSYQCVCVKCRNYKNIEKVAKMRGEKRRIMSNFSTRST